MPQELGATPRAPIIGTAGWSIPGGSRDRFPGSDPHLVRYARIFRGVEINSSFYRPHARTTYEKWAALTPPSFQFSVKVPRHITHELALRRAGPPLDRFLMETDGLGEKRGPLLVQLPPSLAFDRRVVATFFERLRARYTGPVVCEPRHPSWFTDAASKILVSREVSRVATDPTAIAGADLPGGWPVPVYYRLHGSPRKYWSKYSEAYISELSRALEEALVGSPAWCVFDNTASGGALENAWELSQCRR